MRFLPATCLGVTLALTTPLPAQDAPPPLVVVGATLIDGRAAAPVENATVTVIDGVITDITVGPVTPPSGAVVVEARGRYLLPGLIDAHSHLNTLAAARRALESGVTTIRTAGVGGYRDVAIRDLVRDRRLPGPDILATGVYVTPNIGDAILADPRLAGLGSEVQSLRELEHLVRVNVDRGVDWIKTRGTERAGRPETDPREQVYNVTQLETIVTTAAESDIRVMAHAHGDTGIRDAVLAGARSIEHGTYASDETLRLMKERGTYLVPTLSSISSFGQAGDYADPALFLRGLHMAPRRMESVTRAYAMGIPIVTGVDTSYESDSYARVSREIGFLVDVGVSPFDAIRGATSLAAEMLGIEERTGTVEVGREGDLILIERNPLEDIRSIQDLLVVVSNGYVVVNRLDTIDRAPVIPE
jgi:imidazolonepropionase-like amidohydrolase